MIKIVPSGDYVQLKYVDTIEEYVQEELKFDSDAIEYSYDSGGRIYLKFGRMTFEYSDPTEFEIDGEAVTDAADFIEKLTALFSSSSSGSGGLQTATVELSNDDILNLVTTYIEVVPTPGENKLIMMSQALLYWNVSAGAYGNVDGSNDILLVYGSDWQVNASSLVECPSGTTNRVQVLIPWASDSNSGQGIESATMEEPTCVNQPIYVAISNGGSGNLNAGNEANTLKIKIWYQIIDLNNL